jgi:protoporphyrinogen oxidase
MPGCLRTAVIGAGPMGLVAAMELLRRGHAVDVYERDDRIGGMSASFDFDGLSIERYYHFVCRTDEPLFELLRELRLDDTLRWVDTKMGFYHGGRLHRWGTPDALLRFGGLDPVTKIRYALHVLYTKNVRDWRALDRVNAVDWIRRWVGPRGWDVLWKSLFELKFYEHTRELSAAWIGTRIKRVALSRRNLFHESLGYLEGGSARLLERMRAWIEARGGRIHLRAPIDRVEADADLRLRGVVVARELREYDRVLSTAPIQYVPALVPALPEAFAARIRAIDNIAVACVVVKLAKPLSENFWTNINDPAIGIPGVIEYSNLNPLGVSVVYAPYYMPKTHPKFQRPNAEFVEETLGYFARLNPAFDRNDVLATHCHRYEYAQTICPPGFFDRLPPMRTPVDGFYMADTSYYYPEDRSISESVRVGRELAASAVDAATPA